MKTIKIFFILIVYFSVLINISSQSDTIELKKFTAIDTFNLKNYVLPDLKYKSLGFGFDLNTNSNDANSDYNTGSTIEKDNFSSFNFKSHLSLNRYHYINSSKKQSSGRDQFNFNVGYNKVKAWDSIDSDIEWTLGPNFYSERSYKYFNSKNYFLELTSDLSGMFGGYTLLFDFPILLGEGYQIYSGNKNSYNLSFRPGIGIGKGRIEDVTDAWHTIRILKDLEREKLLTDVPDPGQILSIAKRISEIKNDRIFDSRMRRKENLKRLDEALFNTGLIRQRNIDYYKSLFDMWSYGIDFRRLSNRDISLNFAPLISVWNDDYIENKYNGLTSGFRAGLSYNSYNPLNMFWQFDFNATLDFNYIYDKQFLFNYNSAQKRGFLTPSINARLINFISSRAYFSTSFNGQFNYLIYQGSYKADTHSFRINFRNNFVYYLSPSTSLNVSLDFGWYFDKYDSDFDLYFKNNGFGQTFNIGFNHYFY